MSSLFSPPLAHGSKYAPIASPEGHIKYNLVLPPANTLLKAGARVGTTGSNWVGTNAPVELEFDTRRWLNENDEVEEVGGVQRRALRSSRDPTGRITLTLDVLYTDVDGEIAVANPDIPIASIYLDPVEC